MSEAIEVVKEWVKTIGDDVAAVKRVVESDKCPEEARKLAAGALNYLVSRMDLVPDWTDTIGCIDDVMVVRVCMGLASSMGDRLQLLTRNRNRAAPARQHTLRGVGVARTRATALQGTTA